MKSKKAGPVLLVLGAALAFLGGGMRGTHHGLGTTIVHYGAIAAVVGVVFLFADFAGRGGTQRRTTTPPPPAPPPTAPSTRYFYVSAIREGHAIFVTGPYPDHQHASADLDRVRELASQTTGVEDSRAYAWGVSESPVRVDGLANSQLGFQPVA